MWILQALVDEKVDADIGMSLQNMYSSLHGYVQLWPGACSRDFEIRRGVRHCDPLSPILFGLVMKRVLKDLDGSWQDGGLGTSIGKDAISGRRLTHIAFVDDVTLLSRSFASLRVMITGLKDKLAEWGLRIHPSKCKAQTNNEDWSTRGSIDICKGLAIEVLLNGSCLTILGTQLTLETGTAREVQSRISKGWKMFFALKSLLCNRSISLKRRLILFDATVSSGINWCTESWALQAIVKQPYNRHRIRCYGRSWASAGMKRNLGSTG